MKKLLTAGLSLVLVIVLGYFTFVGYLSSFGFKTRLTGSQTGIVRRPDPSSLKREALHSLPETGLYEVVDVRADDLTDVGLEKYRRQPFLVHFDSNTTWPETLPEWLEPQEMLELGKNPGLGVRLLHAQGITGKGVSVGVIDQTLLVDHVEYADRVALYEEIHNFNNDAQAHGPMVASIFAGRTTGVAPESTLYYIARSDWTLSMLGRKTLDYTPTARAIERMLEVNESLPQEKRIRVISVSTDWTQGVAGFDEVLAAAQRARDAGVMVVSVSIDKYYPYDYGGLGRDSLADPDALASYEMSIFVPGQFSGAKQLFVPIDSRTYAGHTGHSVYTFERRGGYSHGAPYVAGLYALACQVNPAITPEQFWERALETADVITVEVGKREEQVRVVNPVALVTTWQ